MKISPALEARLLQDMEPHCLRVRRCDPRQTLRFISSQPYLQAQARLYSSLLPPQALASGRPVLEIGSGYGFFLIYARQTLGWAVTGLEPDAPSGGRYELAAQVLRENGIDGQNLLRGVGEAIPCSSGSFAHVISNDALEHVQDPAAVLREALRVVEQGGLVAFNAPNYRWVYEGHYNIPWVPGLPKPLAKAYVKLWGRDPAFLNGLHFLTPARVKALLATVGGARLAAPLHHRSTDDLKARVEAYKNSAPGRSIVASLAAHALGSAAVTGALSFMGRRVGFHHDLRIVLEKTMAS